MSALKGNTQRILITPPTLDTSAYTAGDVLGGLFTIPNIVGKLRKSAEISTVLLADSAKQSIAADLIIFAASPSASTLTDQAAPVIPIADLPKIIGVVPIVAGDYSAFNASSVACKNLTLKLQGTEDSQDLYGVLITRGTPTYTASALRLTIMSKEE